MYERIIRSSTKDKLFTILSVSFRVVHMFPVESLHLLVGVTVHLAKSLIALVVLLKSVFL